MDQFKPENHKSNMVLISGATGGLGKAFAVECASRGWDIYLTDKYEGPLNSLATGLRNTYGVCVITFPCDLTDQAMLNELFQQFKNDSVRFSMLINVAGIDHEGQFYHKAAQQIRSIIRLNIEATLMLTHDILPYRNPLETFRIINVSSLAAFYPMPVKATYAATKRFLLDFSLALREEVRDLGATVTVLCPAGMPTNQVCIDAIEAQGWAGQITTVDVGRVANQTINAALNGKAIVIPGLINRLLQMLGSIIPAGFLARLIGRRWISVDRKKKIRTNLLTAQ
jgi:hypothetical protein